MMREEMERQAREPDSIRARHVLVMHKESKAKPEDVTRTKEQALARAKQCLLELRGGADFGAMVSKYSDEPGASERGGDLGVFKRETMVKGFSDAAFELKVGEISEVVQTDYGYHVIKRTE
jgi:parvulin-like peptidyl-prolyl isomerase